MVRKKSALIPYQEFFCRPQSCDPMENIVTEVGNVLVNQGLQKMSQAVADRLGLVDPEQEIRLNRSVLLVKKLEAEIARAEKRQADAIERAEELRLRQHKQDLLNEKQARLYDLKIAEKELEIERARNSLETTIGQRTEIDLHIRTEPVSGALEVTANPEGLTGSVEHALDQRIRLWVRNVVYGESIHSIARELQSNAERPVDTEPGEWVKSQIREATKILEVKRRPGRPQKGGGYVTGN